MPPMTDSPTDASALGLSTVDTGLATGQVLEQGAQVLRWAPRGAAPVLYVSSAVRYAAGAPVRGGIPVCWPWFGPGRAGDRSPIHGVVRTARWRLIERREHPDGAVELSYGLDSDELEVPDFADRWTLQLSVRFADTLVVELTTTNTGAEPFILEEALHAYLVVGDIHRTRIEGLAGAAYVDKVAGRLCEQDGPVVFTGETDRVFRRGGTVTVHDPALARTLTVTSTGAANTVIWNPWAAKAAEAADIGDQDWTGFMCVEAANALADVLTVAPGQAHAIGYRLSVGVD